MMSKNTVRGLLAAVAGVTAARAWGTEMGQVQMAALTQPQINIVIRLDVNGVPGPALTYVDDLFGSGTIEHNIPAYFDTGASGILLGNSTADLLGLNRAMQGGQRITYEDVGVGGSDIFHVSDKLHVGLAAFYPQGSSEWGSVYNPPSPDLYTHVVGPIRTQIGPATEVPPDPLQQILQQDLDVVGTPAMAGRVVVMNPRPANINSFDDILDGNFDDMYTWVYDKNTPYKRATQDTDPGIPWTSRHIKLSMASFDRFTTVTPAGAPGPVLAANPFIGPNPILTMEGDTSDTTPGVKATFAGANVTGSWLLDTGAAASMISTAKAAALGIEVQYEEREEIDIFGEITLVQFPVLYHNGQRMSDSDQFTLTISGIGGQKTVAGFYLDELLIRTMEGDANNDNDLAHLRYTFAPVLVNDITLRDPNTDQTLTLDGIFGMNFLSPSLYFQQDSSSWFPIMDLFTFTRYDWLVYDHDAGVLGLELSSKVWMGGPGDKWNYAGGNFTDGQFAYAFLDGDYVKFNDAGYPDVVIDSPVRPGSVTFENSVDYALSGSPIEGNARLLKLGTGTLTITNSNTYQGATEIVEGKVVLASAQDIGPVNVYASGQLVMQTSQRFAELSVTGGQAGFTDGGGKLLVLGKLSIAEGGTLDLAAGAMVIHPTSDAQQVLSEIEDYIRSARGGDGDWAGPGLTSSTARANLAGMAGLGAILNNGGGSSGPIYTEFAGEAVELNAILVRFTWNGDANLDGIVNADDYFQIDSGYILQATGWYNGDFNYDGVINADDYFLIDSSFIGQTGLAAGQLAVAVPEPNALLLLALGTLGLRRRSRR